VEGIVAEMMADNAPARYRGVPVLIDVHQQPEIGRAGVHHQPLQNIFPSAQM
jgi:hypothetical protein